jgi:mannose-1-phosphate guanylyltransferase
MKTYAVILAGGKGERFWPQSRRNMPKQFLKLFGDESLIELTSRRIAPICPIEHQRFVIDYNLGRILGREMKLPSRNFVYEPYGRNTAPALALAAAYIAKEEPDSTLVVLPADHLIENVRAFQQSVRFAVAVAQEDFLVTFGIPPTRPDTSYGYIETGELLLRKGDYQSFAAKRFREKPDLAQAKQFLRANGARRAPQAAPRFLWNSGMFVWRSDAFLHAVELFMPDFYRELMAFQCKIGTRGEKAALEKLYAHVKPESVDYAIMEHARNVAVVGAGFDWDDVGSWSALERHFHSDSAQNVAVGGFVHLESRNCMSLTHQGIVALIGCENLVVVRTPDAVLVCPKERAGDIKKLLAEMGKDKELGKYL